MATRNVGMSLLMPSGSQLPPVNNNAANASLDAALARFTPTNNITVIHTQQAWSVGEIAPGNFYGVQKTFTNLCYYYVTKGVKLVINIGLAITNTKAVPSDLAGTPWGDPAMATRALAYWAAIKTMINQLPALGGSGGTGVSNVLYIALGEEVDTALMTALDWTGFRTVCETLRTQIRTDFPGMQVGVCTTFRGAVGANAANVAALTTNMDLYMLTYYPQGIDYGVSRSYQYQVDFPAMVFLAGARPLILNEVGYQSSLVSRSSQASQAAAVTSFFKAWSATGDQQEIVTITGAPTGGSFTLTYAAVTSGPIGYNAPATGAGLNQQWALVPVTLPTAGTFVIKALAGVTTADTAALNWNATPAQIATALTAVAAAGVTFTVVGQPAGAILPNYGVVITVAGASGAALAFGNFTLDNTGLVGGSFACSISVQGTVSVQAAVVAMASIGANNAIVVGAAGGPWTISKTGTLGQQLLAAFTASGAGLTGGVAPAVAVAISYPGGVRMPLACWFALFDLDATTAASFSAQTGVSSDMFNAYETTLGLIASDLVTAKTAWATFTAAAALVT